MVLTCEKIIALAGSGFNLKGNCLEFIRLSDIILKCRCDIVDATPYSEIDPFKVFSQSTLRKWLISEFKIIDSWLRSMPLLERIYQPDYLRLYECTFPSLVLLRMAFLSRKLENRVYFMTFTKLSFQTVKKFYMNPKLYEGIRKLAVEMKTLNCTDITFIALLLFTQPDIEFLGRKDELEQIHELIMSAFLHWRSMSSDLYWGKICRIMSILRRQDLIILFLFWMTRGFITGVHPLVDTYKHLINTVGKNVSTWKISIWLLKTFFSVPVKRKWHMIILTVYCQVTGLLRLCTYLQRLSVQVFFPACCWIVYIELNRDVVLITVYITSLF